MEWQITMQRFVDILTDAGFKAEKEPFLQFFRACEIAMFDTGTKLLYEKDMITERDYYNIINTARKTGMSEGMSAGMEQGLQRGLQQGLQKGLESGLKKGREEGLRKGREEGLLEGQHRIAKAMKAKGMSSQMITELTGISEDEIADL